MGHLILLRLGVQFYFRKSKIGSLLLLYILSLSEVVHLSYVESIELDNEWAFWRPTALLIVKFNTFCVT